MALPDTPSALLAALLPHLRREPPEDGERRAWTKHVFSSLDKTLKAAKPTPADLRRVGARDKRAHVVPYAHARVHEYMVDYAWSLEIREQYRGYVGLLLAVECEWGPSPWHDRRRAILDDFYKLLDIRARLKSMVFANTAGEFGSLTGPQHARYRFQVLEPLLAALAEHRTASNALRRQEEAYLLLDLGGRAGEHLYATAVTRLLPIPPSRAHAWCPG